MNKVLQKGPQQSDTMGFDKQSNAAAKLVLKQMNTFQVSVRDFIGKNSNSIKSVYRIGKRIGGEGSYGYIRFCIHKQTGCLRAVKVIEKNSLSNIEQTEKDEINEISILRQVDHPGIMRIHEYFED